MLLCFAEIILLSLHTVESRGSRRIRPEVEEILASPGTDVTINCSLPSWLDKPSVGVPWYKEELNRNLHMIYQSSSASEPHGKYSGPSNAPPYGSLTISNVQRNDSGIYYCVSSMHSSFEFLQRTRLIVTNISEPTFSILAPAVLSENQLHHDIPLLCLIFDADPAWENVSWDIDGETSQVLKDVDMIDVNGVFSIWSLKLVPSKSWAQRASDSCSVQHQRMIGDEVSTDRENCKPVLLFGVPCVIILIVILSLILLFRKHLARGKEKEPVRQVHMREIPQTDYAELRYNSHSVVETVQ